MGDQAADVHLQNIFKDKINVGHRIKSVFKERPKTFIDLDGKDLSSRRRQLGRQSASPSADFNDNIIRRKFSRIDNLVQGLRIVHKILAQTFLGIQLIAVEQRFRAG